MKWIKYTPLIIALGFWYLVNSAAKNLDFLYWWEVGAFVWIVLWLFILSKKQDVKVNNWTIRLPFVFFVLCSLSIFLFLDRAFIRQCLAILTSLIVFWYFILSLEIATPGKKEEQKKVVNIINLFSLFFLNAVLFGWLTFLTGQLWLALLTALVVYWFFFLLYFISQNLERGLYLVPSIVLTIVSSELFWIINLLSAGFLVKSLLLTSVILYLGVITTWNLQKKWTQNKFFILTGTLLLLIILVFFSARWL